MVGPCFLDGRPPRQTVVPADHRLGEPALVLVVGGQHHHSHRSGNARNLEPSGGAVAAWILMQQDLRIAGSVAVGKSTTARILQALLRRWPDHPSVDLVTTDGFRQVLQIARSYVPGGLGGFYGLGQYYLGENLSNSGATSDDGEGGGIRVASK